VGNVGQTIDGLDAGDQVLVEVYAGWVEAGHTQSSDNLHRGKLRTFLPIAPGRLLPYPDLVTDDITVTVTAAPANFRIFDEPGNIAVTGAEVSLIKHDKILGDPILLVFDADFAVRQATFFGFTYQATVMSVAERGLAQAPVDIDADDLSDTVPEV
jgi:hypothetical protein